MNQQRSFTNNPKQNLNEDERYLANLEIKYGVTSFEYQSEAQRLEAKRKLVSTSQLKVKSEAICG
jgi:hypothetical protein